MLGHTKSGQCFCMDSVGSHQVRTVFAWIVLGHTKSGQCFCIDSVGSHQFFFFGSIFEDSGAGMKS